MSNKKLSEESVKQDTGMFEYSEELENQQVWILYIVCNN